MAEVFNMELRDGIQGEEDISDDEYSSPEAHQVFQGRQLQEVNCLSD